MRRADGAAARVACTSRRRTATALAHTDSTRVPAPRQRSCVRPERSPGARSTDCASVCLQWVGRGCGEEVLELQTVPRQGAGLVFALILSRFWICGFFRERLAKGSGCSHRRQAERASPRRCSGSQAPPPPPTLRGCASACLRVATVPTADDARCLVLRAGARLPGLETTQLARSKAHGGSS